MTSRVQRLRTGNILYDRDEHGEFFQLYSRNFGEGFFFEIVERRNGYAGYAKISTTSPFSLGLRAETFKDNGGTRLGIGEARVNEFTITPAFKFGSNFVVRAEGRYDSSDSSPFFDDKGIAKKNQATIGLNAIWVY